MTPAQKAALDKLLPPHRLLRWLVSTLEAQSKRTGEPIPLVFSEWLATIANVRANEPPIELAILTEEDWQRFCDELAF